MAENNNDVQSFTLGLIVAAIFFFLLRRELGKFMGKNGSDSRLLPDAGKSKCNCGGGCGEDRTDQQALPSNPGISLGNQSYNSGESAFGSSSVGTSNAN